MLESLNILGKGILPAAEEARYIADGITFAMYTNGDASSPLICVHGDVRETLQRMADTAYHALYCVDAKKLDIKRPRRHQWPQGTI